MSFGAISIGDICLTSPNCWIISVRVAYGPIDLTSCNFTFTAVPQLCIYVNEDPTINIGIDFGEDDDTFEGVVYLTFPWKSTTCDEIVHLKAKLSTTSIVCDPTFPLPVCGDVTAWCVQCAAIGETPDFDDDDADAFCGQNDPDADCVDTDCFDCP